MKQISFRCFTKRKQYCSIFHFSLSLILCQICPRPRAISKFGTIILKSFAFINEIETVIHICSSQQVFLKVLQISRLKTCVGVSSGLQLYQKQTPTHVFSCEICEIFKNKFSYRTPPVPAFDEKVSMLRYTSTQLRFFKFAVFLFSILLHCC